MLEVRINAKGLLCQLDSEVVRNYAATEADGLTVRQIACQLLALQGHPDPITVDTPTDIEPVVVRTLEVPQDTILGALMRLHESVGGYIWVDNDKHLHWQMACGADVGQQLRYRKNIAGITRTVDYSELANRLYVYGGDDIRLDTVIVLGELGELLDSGHKYYDGANWIFVSGAAPGVTSVRCGNLSSTYGFGSFLRFPNLAVPFGATIERAHLRFRGRTWGTTSWCNSRLSAVEPEYQGQPSDLAGYDFYYARRGRILDWNGIETWIIPEWGGGDYVSPDISPIIQEIVDDPNWASGRAMLLFWEDHDQRSGEWAFREATAYDPPTLGPELYIRYPSGAEYIENLPSQNEHGFVADIITNKSITDTGTLDEFAAMNLAERMNPRYSYSIDLVNLEAQGWTAEDIRLGNIVRVIDEELNIDVTARIVRVIRDLVDPLNIQVEVDTRPRDVLGILGTDERWRREHY